MAPTEQPQSGWLGGMEPDPAGGSAVPGDGIRSADRMHGLGGPGLWGHWMGHCEMGVLLVGLWQGSGPSAPTGIRWGAGVCVPQTKAQQRPPGWQSRQLKR